MNQVIDQIINPKSLLHHHVEFIHDMKEKRDYVKGLEDEIKKGIESIKDNSPGIFEHEEIRFKVTPSNGEYFIEFEDTDRRSKEFETLKGITLIAKKEGDVYKFGAEFGEGDRKFRIGESNPKFPFRSQVSALEEFQKNLILIATATGSGKTIKS